MNGPEPMASVICVLGSVSATRLGIMKAMLADRLAERIEHQAVWLLQHHLDRPGIGRASSATTLISFWPIESLAPQRFIEATQSAP